jgi:NAD(P)-dependent dehydrogenase (short-subunit alcohol dehydrogenase family)
MIKAGTRGSIVQISSIYGVNAPDQRIYEGSEYNGRPINTPAVYSVSKAGVIALSAYLAAYWGGKGIRVNTISPGGMFSGQNAQFVMRYSDKVPMNRMGDPKELEGALLLLASDASSYITGQNFLIDGGLTIW